MSIVLFSADTQSTMSPGPHLLAAYKTFKTGALYKKYMTDNPVESAGIDNYWLGGEKPAAARTATGKALLEWADIYRSI
jgi:hypothetical protein